MCIVSAAAVIKKRNNWKHVTRINLFWILKFHENNLWHQLITSPIKDLDKNDLLHNYYIIEWLCNHVIIITYMIWLFGESIISIMYNQYNIIFLLYNNFFCFLNCCSYSIIGTCKLGMYGGGLVFKVKNTWLTLIKGWKRN